MKRDVPIPRLRAAVAGLAVTSVAAFATSAGGSAGAAPRPAGSGAPPLCVKLAPAAMVAKALQVRHLSGPNWHLDGMPTTYCAYGASPDQATVSVLRSSGVSGFDLQVKLSPGKTRMHVPGFGSHATAIKDCVLNVCQPILVVLSHGDLVDVSDQLGNTSWSKLSGVESIVRHIFAELHVPA